MPEKLKDLFFTASFIAELAEALHRVCPDFDGDRLSNLVFDASWESRELKERMRHVTECLHETLDREYPEALEILIEIAPSFSGFDTMVFPDYVQCYGLEHWDLSLPALAFFTPLCSSEYAIRPFLDRDPQRAMEALYTWAEDENPHLRRLASEGCRPRLPWGMALPQFKKDPSPILPVLEKLKDDPSEYVRKSVANNLNEISKDHPQLVLDICERWYGHSANTDWIVKHACRGLLKAGNRRAMHLFGLAETENLSVLNLTLDRHTLSIGEELPFTFELRVDTAGPCLARLEYSVQYARPEGKVSRKMFQIKEQTFEPGTHSVSRKLSLVDQSTRQHHPGQHQVSIIVNGVEMASSGFELTLGGETR
ncbi:MAG TPA: DNA alkylation repair protein [Anaerolineae bacterium]|nr:DNA alkylation repair protein [Anaerolineae bacterium]